MAQQENGVSISNTAFVDLCSTSTDQEEKDVQIGKAHCGDSTNDSNNHSIDVCIGSPSAEHPKTDLEDPSSVGTDSVPACSLDTMGDSGERRLSSQDKEQNDVRGAVFDSEEATGSKSIEAISLVDIKASFKNEELNGNCDITEGNHAIHGQIVASESNPFQANGFQNLSNVSISKCSENDPERKGPVSPKTNNELTDVIVTISKENSHKIIPSYAIQPGELTDQLIEGPSITLPSSEIVNRRNSSSNSSVHPLSESIKPEQSKSQETPSIGHSELIPESIELGTATNVMSAGINSVSPGQPLSQTNVPSSASSSSSSPSYPSSASESGTILPSDSSATSITSNISGQFDPATSAPAPPKRVKKTPHDFIFGKVIGEGSYSTVYLAKEVSTQREFAVKVCEKKHLIREKKTHFVMREKEVLMKLDHPFFIKLAFTFQDPERLYYVLTYARNGELLSYLNKLSAFDVPCTQFYSAEIVIALEYLQSLGIIHRDLKPENILFGDDMHIKITDFGTSKIFNGSTPQQAEDGKGRHSKRKNSFVGTAEYVSPEVLNGLPANYGTDLWALACIIYQCLSSSLPFRCGNEYQTFQKILKLDYDFPEGFHEEAKDLVQRLLVIEPTERLGMKEPGGMQALKEHPFFQGVDWENIPNTTPPKLLPYLPASANNPEFWGGQDQRTGFDDQRLAEIITGQSAEGSQSPELEPISPRNVNNIEENERKEKIEKQRQENQFHQFVENNLILRQGFVDKRKGFFARKRMLLLTEGPHLYYVDAHNKVLKGEIPWSRELQPEAKNFKIFFVHTPNRTYYLESRNPDAHHWVQRIQEVWNKYYGNNKES